jgi:hypothetical protein
LFIEGRRRRISYASGFFWCWETLSFSLSWFSVLTHPGKTVPSPPGALEEEEEPWERTTKAIAVSYDNDDDEDDACPVYWPQRKRRKYLRPTGRNVFFPMQLSSLLVCGSATASSDDDDADDVDVYDDAYRLQRSRRRRQVCNCSVMA